MAKRVTGPVFGWCQSNLHKGCSEKYERWYVGIKRVNRRTVETIVWTGEEVHCGCTCHKG